MTELEKITCREWRLNHLYTIINKDSDKIQFKQNPIQKIINESTDKRKIVLKARQFGISTNEVLKLFDDTIWNRNRTNVILAHEADAIKKLFRIARRAFDFMPKELQPRLDRGGGSMYEMFFPDINSRIYCDLESRGDTISNLLASECAFMRDSLRLKATLQSVPLKGNVTIETTPNGMANFFYEMWEDDLSIYKKLFFPWYLHDEYRLSRGIDVITEDEKKLKEKAKKLFGVTIDEYQLAFRRFKQNELGKLFLQEYPEDDVTCFLTSGHNVIDSTLLKELMETAIDPIEKFNQLSIYRKKVSGHRYVIGADTSEGVGKDYSVGSVFDVNTFEQVAVLRGQFRPHEFAHELSELAQRYVHGSIIPEIVVERNNHGHAVLLELSEHINYNNLYRSEDGRYGWVTNRISRPLMLDAFIQGLESRKIILNHLETLKECVTLIDNNGKIEAASGKHDDCVMASAMAIQRCIANKSLDIYDNIEKHILL